jgi:multiple sugar transport system substrate-binding protein
MKGEFQMRKYLVVVLVVAGCMSLTTSLMFGQVLPGATVEERAINGAKAYLKKHNLKEPKLTLPHVALFHKAQLKYNEQWKELTGVKVNSIPYGFWQLRSKIMAEAEAKTGDWDIFFSAPYLIPDAVGAGIMMPLDDYAKKGKPDFSGMVPSLRAQQYYNGKLYFFLLDGDHLMLVLRKDIMDLAKDDYKAKFGKECGCPQTLDEWEQMADYFHTKKGETRWGIKFHQPLYGALAYRSMTIAHGFFPVYFTGLYFDKDMKPRINTPEGIEAIKKFASIVKYMPEDILRWLTPQLYPFWASGQAFSAMSFPSIVGYGNKNPKSRVSGKQLSCLIPGVKRSGKLIRRSPQALGPGWSVSRYSKHPELAYYFIQWLSGPAKGDELIADPMGFWDPLRESNLTNPAILKKFGKQLVETTIGNTEFAVSLLMIRGNSEYQSVLTKNLTQVIQEKISAEKAAKQIEEGWNKITDDIGREDQIKAWRAGVEMGAYIDKFD